MATHESILVIGAGISGLAAARTLSTWGFEVTVLEARDRVGGRIWTSRDPDGVSFDLGAQWIVGTQKNPILDLVHLWRLDTVQTDWDDAALFVASKTRLPPERQREIERRLASLIARLQTSRFSAQAQGRPDCSLRSAIDELVDTMDLTSATRSELEYVLTTDIEHEFGADLSDLSFYEWDREGRLVGEELLVRGGFDQIPQRLASGLDVRTSHIVRRIVRSTAGVVVETDHCRLCCTLLPGHHSSGNTPKLRHRVHSAFAVKQGSGH